MPPDFAARRACGQLSCLGNLLCEIAGDTSVPGAAEPVVRSAALAVLGALTEYYDEYEYDDSFCHSEIADLAACACSLVVSAWQHPAPRPRASPPPRARAGCCPAFPSAVNCPLLSPRSSLTRRLWRLPPSASRGCRMRTCSPGAGASGRFS